jgi:hypothetical protein
MHSDFSIESTKLCGLPDAVHCVIPSPLFGLAALPTALVPRSGPSGFISTLVTEGPTQP